MFRSPRVESSVSMCEVKYYVSHTHETRAGADLGLEEKIGGFFMLRREERKKEGKKKEKEGKKEE